MCLVDIVDCWFYGETLAYQESLNPSLAQTSFVWQEIELHSGQGGQTVHEAGQSSRE
jgi:hypothetical protein